MRTDLSLDFLRADSAAIQTPRVQAVIRPNPTVLRWNRIYSRTGRAGVIPTGMEAAGSPGAAYGWQGADAIHGGGTTGSVCVTPDDTLVRSFGVPQRYWREGPIFLNTVPGTAAETSVLSLLQQWSRVPNATMLQGTREAVAAFSASVGHWLRCFWISQHDGAIWYQDSMRHPTRPGMSWLNPVRLDGSRHWNLTALAAPRPDLLFAASRQHAGHTNGDPGTMWIDLHAWQLFPSGTDSQGVSRPNAYWQRTRHIKSSTRARLVSSQAFWDGEFQFTAAIVDPDRGSCVLVYMDDLAGRPAAVLYENRMFSDHYPVEAIDFAEPEQDEIRGFRASRIGDKVVLAGRRILSDSDFVHARHGVLYYSTNGRDWSDAYYIGESSGAGPGDPGYDPVNEGAPYNWGTPILWRKALWLVGNDSLWRTEPTSLFGDPLRGIEGPALDVTAHVRSVRVDEPENPTAAAQGDITLKNELRLYHDHPLVRYGGELEIRAGYVGQGTLVNRLRNPSVESDSVGWTTGDSASHLERSAHAAYDGVVGLHVIAVQPTTFLQVGVTDQPIDPAVTDTFSIHVRNETVPGTGTIELHAVYRGGAVAAAAQVLLVGLVAEAVGTWRRVSAPFRADQPDRTHAAFFVRFTGVTDLHQSFFADAAQLEHGSQVSAYTTGESVWRDTELVRVFQGHIDQVGPQDVANVAGTLQVQATDYSNQIRHGQTDRAIVVPDPGERVTYRFDTESDLQALVPVAQSKWRWVNDQAHGEQYITTASHDEGGMEPGVHWLGFTTGLAGRVTIAVNVRTMHPHHAITVMPEDPDLGGRQTVGIVFGASSDFSQYYIVKWGRTCVGMELWKVRATYEYRDPQTGKATRDLRQNIYRTLLARSSAVPMIEGAQTTWPQFHEVEVTHQMHRILVQIDGFTYINIEDPVPLLDVLLAGPDGQSYGELQSTANCAVRVEIPPLEVQTALYSHQDLNDPEKPVTINDYAVATHFDMIRVVSHERETTVEEFLHRIATQRGFTHLRAEAQLDERWASGSLNGWTVLGGRDLAGQPAESHWRVDPGRLQYVDTGRAPMYRIWGLQSGVWAQNLVIDLDMQMEGTGGFGILARASPDGQRYALLTISIGGGCVDATDPRWARVRLYVNAPQPEGPTFVGFAESESLVPIFGNGEGRTWFRFVVDGPWYSVYANGVLARTFYDETLVAEGYWGLSAGLGMVGGTHQTTTIYQVRIPWLGLANYDPIPPGETLDKYLTTLLEGRQAWMVADGRTLRVGRTLAHTPVGTLRDARIMGGGYSVAYDQLPCAIRVVSKTASGLQIWGSAYSPTIAERIGRLLWRVISVDGLRDEDECRERAWQELLTIERSLRPRAYPVHPSLQYERFDLVEVTNTLDDTNGPLYIMGVQRSWERQEQSPAMSAQMTVRLQEQNATALVRARYYQPRE